MELVPNKIMKYHYLCEITSELTNLLKAKNDLYYVYIEGMFLEDDFFKKKNLGIRVPGSTIGYIALNDNYEIKEIKIAYWGIPKFIYDPNEYIQKFIGTKLEIKKEG